jgi:hypothetical protein
LKYYDYLHELYGQDKSTGKFAMSSVKVTPVSANATSAFGNILTLMILILDEENSYSDLDSPIPPESSKIEPGTEPSDMEEIEDYEQLLIKEGLRKKRPSSNKATEASSAKRRSSAFLGAANIAADGLRDLSSGIASALIVPQATKFDQCLPLLNKLRDDEDLEDHDYFRFCDFLMRNQTYASMFYGMIKDLRFKWLKAKCPDSAENGNNEMY